MRIDLAAQLDYIYFFYGLAFFIMALACGGMARPAGKKIPWGLLGAFGVVHGLNEWLDLVAYSLGDSAPFAAFRLAILLLSFLFLAEFGRAGLKGLGFKVPGRWSLAVPVAVAALGGLYGFDGLNAASRYSAGLVGGLCSAYFLVRSGVDRRDGSFWLVLSGFTLGLYSLAAGFIVPQAGFYPASAVNYSSFLSLTGIPVQLIRGVMAVMTALFIIAYYRSTVIKKAGAMTGLYRAVYTYTPVGVIIAIVLAGWIVTENVGRRDFKDYNRLHFNWARTIASSLGPEHIGMLVTRPESSKGMAYRVLRDHLMQIRHENPDCSSVLVRTLEEGVFVLVADGERENSPAHRRFGEVVKEASADELAGYAEGKASMNEVRAGGRLTEMTFNVPVYSPSGDVIAQLSIGFDPAPAIEMVKEDRLSIITITCVFCLFTIAAFIAWYRTRQSLAQTAELELASYVAENERKLRAITSALGEGVLQLDEKGVVVFVNPEAERLLRWKEHELTGLDGHDTLHRFRQDGSSARREDCPSLKVLSLGVTIRADDELFTRKDGTSFPVSYVTAPIVSKGKVVGAVVAFQDVTGRKAAETAIRESERSYRTLSENLPGIVYRITLGETRRVQFFNEMILPMTGYTADELEGGTLCALGRGILEEDKPRALNAVNMSVMEGAPFQVEYRFAHKDGGVRHFIERGRTIFGPDGKAAHIDGLILDRTERKRAESELYKFKFIVEGSGEEIYLIDSAGRFEYANETACRSLGYSLAELRSLHLYEIDPAYGGEKDFMEHLGRLRRRQEPAFETEHVTKDGRRVAKEVKAELLVMDGREFICAIVRDITERKELERQRMDFFGIVTHDLKSPLTVISGYADMILTGYRDRIPDEVGEACEAISRSCERLTRLVDSYLTISRLESGVLRLESAAVEPRTLVYDAAVTARALAAARGQEVVVEADEASPEVKADYQYLLRAVVNLVQNAVNYSPQGATITLGCGTEVKDGVGYVSFRVSDSGPGIAADEREKIFEKYYRSPKAGGVKGSGLGLAIVKAVAEAHGGMVLLDTEPGRGSTFRLLIPA